MELLKGQRRIDAGKLAKPVRRADGSMVVQAQIARTGTQRYADASYPSGWRVEYRPPSEVGHADSLESLRLIPFTVLHPPVEVTPENSGSFSRGTTGQDVAFNGTWVTASLALTHKDAIGALARMNQISVGYSCDLEMTPGVAPDGTRYDCVQRNIRGNHVALVPDARAGAEAAIRMDAAASETDDTITKDTHMDTAALTAKLTEALTEVAKATARADAADAKAKELTVELGKITAERDAAKERADAADKARTDAAGASPALVQARVSLNENARKILGSRCDAAEGKTPELDLAKATDRDVKLAVIKHVTNVDALEACKGKDATYTEVYVDARYDAACERAVASGDTFRDAAGVIAANRADGSTGSKARSDARDAMIKANQTAGIPAATATK